MVRPIAVSAAVHVALLVCLGLIVVAVDIPMKPVAIILDMTAEPSLDDHAAVEMPSVPEAAGELQDDPSMSAAVEVSDQVTEMDLDPPLVASDITESLTLDSSRPLSAVEVPLSEVSMEALLATEVPATDRLARGAVAPVAAGGGGITGNGRDSAGGRGRGAGATSFFGHAGQGRAGQAKSVCFICDNSNSYRDGGFHAVLDELARAVDSLSADQSFFVVFFSDTAYPLFHPRAAAGLQPANPDTKRKLREWLSTVEMCSGGQGIHEAVKLAGTLDADVVYFLSDGDHAAGVVDRVVAADFGAAVVHTYGVQQGLLDRRTGAVDPGRLQEQQIFNQNLLSIAKAHGGGFTPVTIPPQAALLERVRPIHKNRFRGAVWGIKL